MTTTTTAPTETAPLDLLAAYDAGPRYEMPDGRTVRLTSVDADGARAWVTVSRGSFDMAEGVLLTEGTLERQSGAGSDYADMAVIGRWLAGEIRGRLELRDRTIAALEHLDRVSFRFERAQANDPDEPWAAAARVIAREPVSLSILQRAGIGKARVVDLLRSGVIVPVLPS